MQGKEGALMDCSVVLCADSASIRYPEIIGLSGEDLEAQSWLKAFSSASEARRFIQRHPVETVWVTGSDDIDPVNGAAAFKKDMARGNVILVTDDPSCSLQSRATRADIDAVVTAREFAIQYGAEKQRRRRVRTGGSHSVVPLRSERARADAARVQTADARRIMLPQVARPAARQAFVMPVLSGSGGSGKSTVSVLSALLAQARGYRTLLLDLDMQFGDLAAVLSIDDPLRLDDAVDCPERLGQLKAIGGIPSFIAAPRHLERAEELASALPWLFDTVQADYDVIIANTGGFWAEQHAVMLERSSRALFLIDQRPSSLQSCRRAIELCTRCNIATSPLLFAVNRCAKGALYTSIDISCSLNGASAIELRDGGREVEEFVFGGQPLELLGMQNELCESLSRVLADVLPEREALRSEGAVMPSSRRQQRRLLRSSRRRDAACLG